MYYVDFHVLQTLPPSCVNRDDVGKPKTAIYGGVTRARVSSQAWKHAIRKAFNSNSENLGFRTLQAPKLIAQYLDSSEEAEALAVEALAKAGVKAKDVLFFISSKQAQKLAELIKAKEKDTALYKAALKESPSVDMALFGRMVAENPELNFDASCQVAHAISTHMVKTEYDYFVALDDLEEDTSFARFLGNLEYNSAVMYRYATINILDLYKMIRDSTAEAVSCFAKAFIETMPTGKQNSYANRTLPDLVYVAVREDQPINLVGAFEKPVSGQEGFIELSKKALFSYAKEVYKNYCSYPTYGFVIGYKPEIDNIASVNITELLSTLKNTLKTLIALEVKW